MSRPTRSLRCRAWLIVGLVALYAPRPAAAFLPTPRSGSRTESLRRDGFAGVPAERAFHLPTGPLPETYRYQLLVLLVEFRDQRADQRNNAPAEIHQRIFGPDSTSLASYWRRASGGRFDLAGQVTRWVRLDSTYAYYASEGAGNSGNGLDPFAYPHNAQRLVEEAVGQIVEDYRWSEFDNNDDGLIDGVLVIHAGPGLEEDPTASGSERTTFLAHQYHTSYEVPARGLRVYDYALASEQAGLGPLAHEFGHLLGLVDLYQTGGFAGSNGPWGLGDWSLMGTGALLGGGARPAGLDGVSRLQLGFVTADTLVPGSILEPREVSPDDAGRIVVPVGPGPEYFLIEARRRRADDSLLPGEGLLVYHADFRSQTNSAPARYRVGLIQADGRNDLGTVGGNRGDGGDPFPGTAGRVEFGSSTTPSSRSNDGADTGLRIEAIGAAEGGGIAFRLARTRPVHLEVTGVAATEVNGNGDGLIEPGEHALVSTGLCNNGTEAMIARTGSVIVGRGPDTLRVLPVLTTPADGTIGARNCAPAPWTTLLFLAPTETPRDAIRAELRAISDGGGAPDGARLLIPLRPGRPRAFDFPAGDSDWTAPGPASGGLSWRLEAVERVRSGPLSWHFGTAAGQVYSARADASLESPGLVVPADGRLSFWSFIDAETLSSGRAWDGGRIEVTTDGANWSPLVPSGGYPFLLETGSGNPLYGQAVLSGHDHDWRRFVCDLAPWSGRAIQVRFRFGSDAFGVSPSRQGQSGWWIDDVSLEASGQSTTLQAQALPAEGRVHVSGFSAGPGAAEEWDLFRRPAWVESVPRWIARIQAVPGGAGALFEYDDHPEAGDWLYSIRPDEPNGLGLESFAPVVHFSSDVAPATFDCFPNPWRLDGPPLNVDYSLPAGGKERRGRLDLFDIGGRFVASLPDVVGAGAGRLQWSGPGDRRLAAGLYFLRLTIDGKESRVRRLMVVR